MDVFNEGIEIKIESMKKESDKLGKDFGNKVDRIEKNWDRDNKLIKSRNIYGCILMRKYERFVQLLKYKNHVLENSGSFFSKNNKKVNFTRSCFNVAVETIQVNPNFLSNTELNCYQQCQHIKINEKIPLDFSSFCRFSSPKQDRNSYHVEI